MKKLAPVSLPQGADSEYDRLLSVMLYKHFRDQQITINQIIDEVAIVQYTSRTDYIDAATTYEGEAVPGSATSAAVWRVKKIATLLGDVAVTWADGNANFDNIWDNRVSLTYT